MIYTWKCKGCGHYVDIRRPAVDYKSPPDEEEMNHSGCEGTDFIRILTVPKSVKVIENEAQYFRRDKA